MRLFFIQLLLLLPLIIITIPGCGGSIDILDEDVDSGVDPSSNDPVDDDSDEEPSDSPDSDDGEEMPAEESAENPSDDSEENPSTNNEETDSSTEDAASEQTSEADSSSEADIDNSSVDSQETDSAEVPSTESASTESTENAAADGGTVEGTAPPDDGGSEETSPPPVETACDPDFSLVAVSTDIGGGLDSAYEPSGAVWHSGLDKLFIVDDEGTVSTIDSNGENITNWTLGGDLEGITVADMESDFIYIGVENPDSIKEFNVATGQVTRTFTLTTWMTGAYNQGLEALTFVADETNSEGGYFYAGHQGEGKIYVFNLPIVSSATSTTVTYVQTITPVSGWSDISGLDYDKENKKVYVIYDSYNTLLSMKTDGTLVDTWSLPGNDQEGIALGAQCEWYVTEDDTSHDVWKYEQ